MGQPSVACCSAGPCTVLAPAGLQQWQAPSDSAAPAAAVATASMHKLIGEWTSWFKPASAPAGAPPDGTGGDGVEPASEAAGHALTPPSQQGSEPDCERQQADDCLSAGRAAEPGAGGSLGHASEPLRREQGSLPQPPESHPAGSGQQAAEEQPSDESQHEDGRPQQAAACGEHCDASSDTDVSMGDRDWDVSLSQSPAAAPAWLHGPVQKGTTDVRAAQPSDAQSGLPAPAETRPSTNQPSHDGPNQQVAEPAVSPPQPAKGAATAPEAQPAATAVVDGGRDAEAPVNAAADGVPPHAAERGGVGDVARRALDAALGALPTASAAHPNFIILSSSSGDDTDGSDDEPRGPAARPASPPSQSIDAEGLDAQTPGAPPAAAPAPEDPGYKPEQSPGGAPPSSAQQSRPPRVTPLTPPPMRSPARADMRAQGWQPQQHRRRAEPVVMEAASGPEVRGSAAVSTTDREAAHGAKRRRIDGGAADAWRAAHGTGPLWGSEATLSKPSEAGAGDGVAGRGAGSRPANGARAGRTPAGSPVKGEGMKRPATAAAAVSPAMDAAQLGGCRNAAEQHPAKRTKASVVRSRPTASPVAEPHEDVLIRPKEAQRQKQRAQAGSGHQAAAGTLPGHEQRTAGAQSGVRQRLPGLGTSLSFRAARAGSKAGAAAAASASAPPGEDGQRRHQQPKEPQARSRPAATEAKHRVPSGWVSMAGSGADRPQDVASYVKQSRDVLQQMMRDASREASSVSRTCIAPEHRVNCRVRALPNGVLLTIARMHQFQSLLPREAHSMSEWSVQDSIARREAARAAATARRGAASAGPKPAAVGSGHGAAAAERRKELRATWEAAKRKVAQPKVRAASCVSGCFLWIRDLLT